MVRPAYVALASMLFPMTMFLQELCVAGDLVGIGYLNRPDAGGYVTTADGTFIYRTGDVVRMMEDDVRTQSSGRRRTSILFRHWNISAAAMTKRKFAGKGSNWLK